MQVTRIELLRCAYERNVAHRIISDGVWRCSRQHRRVQKAEVSVIEPHSASRISPKLLPRTVAACVIREGRSDSRGGHDAIDEIPSLIPVIARCRIALAWPERLDRDARCDITACVVAPTRYKPVRRLLLGSQRGPLPIFPLQDCL